MQSNGTYRITIVEGNVVLSQAVSRLGGGAVLWLECCLSRPAVCGVLYRGSLCLLEQESSFWSSWPPLLQADCWDAVRGVSAHRVLSLSLTLFTDQSLREHLSLLLLCMAAAQTPTLGILSLGRVNYFPSSVFSLQRLSQCSGVCAGSQCGFVLSATFLPQSL